MVRNHLCKCWISVVRLSLTLVIVIVLLQVQKGYSQSINVKVKVSGPQLSEYQILVKDNGKTMNSEFTSRHKTKLELEFGKDYALVFRRDGFRSKSVSVNTGNVPFYMKYELLDFSFEMILDQPCMNCLSGSGPQVVAYWFFDQNLGEFNYTYDEEEAMLRGSTIAEHLVGP